MSNRKKYLKILSAITALTFVAGAGSMVKAAIMGDANGDGLVGNEDIKTLGSFIVGSSDNVSADADMNNDGTVNVFDMISLRRTVAENPVSDANYIHLNGSTISTEGSNMSLNSSSNVVTITASGTYYVDGTLDDGQILVNVADETVDTETVKIFLCGASITGKSAPAIFVENAENTSINLETGTENYLSDGTVAYEGDYLETAVLHAKDDMTIKGDGTLNITANTQYAIHCNNDVKFNGGTVNIESLLEDAVRGKKSVTIKNGTLNIDSEGDGIKSTKGDVAIEGGTVSVKAGNDAIQAETTIDISGGTVTAGGDRGLTATTGVNITGGSVIATATETQTDSALLSATQGTILLNCIADTTNTDDGCWKKANKIVINDSLTFAPVKKYMYALVSDPSITSGSTYTLKNESTGATITHTNETANSFSMTSAVTSFNTVNINPNGSSEVITENTITLSSSGIKFLGSGAEVSSDGKTVTVKEPGTYSVVGDMTGGQIVVDVDKTTYADGKVELDLMGVNLTNTTNSPIYVAQIGDEVQVVAKNGYENVISDGTSYTNADGGMGAIYSCDDLKIKGSGNLTVNGNAEDGIVSKNDLKIYNGNITVNAVDDCIRGKDSVTIGDSDDTDFSSLNVTVNSSNGKGIKSNATDTATSDKTYGVITVNGGNVNVTSYADAIHAAQQLNINGGDFTIKTTCPASSSSASAKGLKAGATDDTTGTSTVGTISVNGGTFDINTTDDCVHSSGNITLVKGTMELTSGDDAVHSDADVTIGQGSADTYDDVKIIVYSGYEGIEGLNINMNSGTVIASTTDDGFNAAGGADGSGSNTPGGWGGNGGMNSGGGNYSLNLKGGFSIVSVTDGDHDGYDSNGSLTISGGTHITNGNEPFDCDGTMSYTGGVYVKNTGSGGMGGGMGGMGGSGSMTESVSASCSVSAGTRITLCDGSGNVIVSFIADKSVSNLVAGCTAYSNASFYTGGTLSGSTYYQELDDTQLAAYGGTLSGGTQVSGGSSSTQPW